MECDLCRQPFDTRDHLPKCLPCAHTFCLQCMRFKKPKKCPIDGKIFKNAADLLPDNFKLMEACFSTRGGVSGEPGESKANTNITMQEAVSQTEETKVPTVEATVQTMDTTEVPCQSEEVTVTRVLNFWCLDCEAASTTKCLEEHSMCSVKALRSKRCAQAQGQLGALAAAEATMAGLHQLLQGAARNLDSEVTTCHNRFQDKMVFLAEARARLETALMADSAEWERAKQAAPQYVMCTEAARFLTDVLEATSSCSIVLSPAVGGAARPAWRGSFQPANDALAKLLLSRLLLQGGLQCDGQEAPQDELTEEQRNLQHEEMELEEQEEAIPPWEIRSNDLPSLSPEDMAVRMRVGSRVSPGRDWDVKTCGSPGQGKVVTKIENGMVYVRWLKGDGRASEYSMGAGGKYCLKLRPGLGAHNKRTEDRFMDPKTLYLSYTDKNLNEMTHLLMADRLQTTSSLAGLNCSVSPVWAEQLLKKVQPHLETLLTYAPNRRHLLVMRDMPLLTRLCFTSPVADSTLPLGLTELYFHTVTPQQLMKIPEMPQLRRLEVHCIAESPMPDMTFARVEPPAGLQYLRTGIYPLRTALSLVSAHAATLEELELVAASDEPYGCPDLPQAIRRCGLKRLKRMVLLRDSIRGFCRHEDAACRRQKRDLWEMFIEGDIITTVKCSICDDYDDY